MSSNEEKTTNDLEKWCSANGFGRCYEELSGESFQITSLEQLRELESEDIDDICNVLRLNEKEKKKFIDALKNDKQNETKELTFQVRIFLGTVLELEFFLNKNCEIIKEKSLLCVKEWCEQNGVGKYHEAIKNRGYSNQKELGKLEKQAVKDLIKEINLPLGIRRRFEDAVKKLTPEEDEKQEKSEIHRWCEKAEVPAVIATRLLQKGITTPNDLQSLDENSLAEICYNVNISEDKMLKFRKAISVNFCLFLFF
ncbi:hypothetical protein RFI_40376 [Reticulomyxa filosa]|uniref:SAM domain-containing protein n=1 Tax=Reticulomyxa filosa TaxID=46433 RepID=X6L8S9_RETFI|nr:hypothetical protein RFI_40376 [Reticulomyxa filosa]|eukprot:ETN97154.1 hypothetical protein RFI_40376 [Reticulomyxa filosa]